MSSGHPLVLTLTELRVLSGLSRGAAMPLDERIVIGSDFACDLILVDPGVNERHAAVSRDEAGKFSISLLSAHPNADSESIRSPRSKPVGEGEAFDVAGIRMLICQSDAEWDFALPVAQPAPLSAIEAAVADGVAAGRLGAGAALAVQPRQRVNLTRIVVATSAVLALLAALTLAWLYFDAEPPPPIPTPAVVQRVYGEADVEAIAVEFASRLDELNIPALKLAPAPQQLGIQGFVDRSSESRFEGAVQELRNGHPGLKVRLDLSGTAASALPFEVSAAVGGSNGSVLLSDGQQLFVGAEEAGFKFLGLMGNCLNFLQVATQQKISQCSDQNQPRR